MIDELFTLNMQINYQGLVHLKDAAEQVYKKQINTVTTAFTTNV